MISLCVNILPWISLRLYFISQLYITIDSAIIQKQAKNLIFEYSIINQSNEKNSFNLMRAYVESICGLFNLKIFSHCGGGPPFRKIGWLVFNTGNDHCIIKSL